MSVFHFISDVVTDTMIWVLGLLRKLGTFCFYVKLIIIIFIILETYATYWNVVWAACLDCVVCKVSLSTSFKADVNPFPA